LVANETVVAHFEDKQLLGVFEEVWRHVAL
jgi:hypothetical protein